MSKKPGENTGKDGGIYRELDSQGNVRDNWATVRDNEKLPPTSHPGHTWKLVKRTPDSKK